MKLLYIRLSDKSMQTAAGRLPETLSTPAYALELVANLRTVKVMSREWEAPVYIPLERLDNFTPDPDAFVVSTKK